MNEITTKERALAVAAHVGFFLGGIGYLVLPFLIRIIWSDNAFIAAHARQAFRIQLVALVVSLLIVILAFVISPMIATVAGIAFLSIAWVFFSVFAAIKAMAGELYEYPALKVLHLS